MSPRPAALILLASLAAAQAEETAAPVNLLASPSPYASKIDLNPLWSFWARPFGPNAIRFRFGESQKAEAVLGSSASALLFSLSILSAFIPAAFPAGMRRAFRGQGHPGAELPPMFGGGNPGIGGIR